MLRGILSGETGDTKESGVVGAQCTIESTIVKTGTYSFKQDYDIASAQTHQNFPNTPTGNHWYFSFHYYKTGNSTEVDGGIIKLMSILASGESHPHANPKRALSIDSLGRIVVRETTTVLGRTTTQLANNTWYHVEYYHNNTSGSVQDVLKLNGTTEVNSSSGASFTFNIASLGGYNGKNNRVIGVAGYVDNGWFNDANGSFNNTNPGELFILASQPNGNSVTAGYTDFTNQAAATASFADVDEIPTNSDTDYAESGSGDGTLDHLFEYEDSATIGVPSTDDILAIVVMPLTKLQSGSTGGAFWSLIQSGGSDSVSQSNLAMAGYNQYWQGLHDSDPNTGDYWTQTDFDSVYAGISKRSAGDKNFRVSTCLVMVAYGTLPVITTPSIVGWKTLLGVGNG